MPVRLQPQDFDISAEIDALVAGRTDIGAVVTFTGLVRDMAKGAPILDMTLEHYPGMCEAELERIEGEANTRWELQGALILHRYGKLSPGERIVLVVTLSPHRHAAFEAAAFLMDYLKTRAPFWKKETGVDGTGHWVDARDIDEQATARWDGASAVPPQ
jgi:molybdopterin synthase catalytic subunit